MGVAPASKTCAALIRPWMSLTTLQFPGDGRQARDPTDDHQHEHDQLAVVLQPRPASQVMNQHAA